MVRSGETSSAVAASSIVGRMPCASLVWHCICMVQVACVGAQSEDTVMLCLIKIAPIVLAFFVCVKCVRLARASALALAA